MKTIAATEFKTHCLSILDEVCETGEEVVVQKRGRPVARVIPVAPAGRFPQASLRGTMRASDDLIDPPLPAEAWEALR